MAQEFFTNLFKDLERTVVQVKSSELQWRLDCGIKWPGYLLPQRGLRITLSWLSASFVPISTVLLVQSMSASLNSFTVVMKGALV